MGALTGPSCACGNPGVLRCEECRGSVCRLCVRKGASGQDLCLACRSFAIEREESALARARASKSARLAGAITGSRKRPATRIRKHVIFFPAAIAVALAAMTAIAVPILADARGARAERRASEALHAIFVAESAVAKMGYLRLDELEQKKLVEPVDIEGYDLKVELARDKKSFWARAVPTKAGLRAFYMDARGEISVDQGY